VRIETPQGTRNVVFYRSNSSAAFRNLPSYHRSGWYDKSFSEEALTAGPELQQILNSRLGLANAKPPVTIRNMEQLEGVTKIYDFPGDGNYLKFKDQMASQYREVSLTQDVPRPLKDEAGRSFAQPQSVKIQNPEKAPNFEKPTRTYTLENRTYGKVTAEVFPSRDGSVEFTIMRDEGGHAWISDIGTKDKGMDLNGLRSDFINSKELTSPRWEYTQQIPDGYVGRRNGSYSSNWKYIREMPEIQRYYRERGLTMPGGD
jgi:hypothetical protein